MAAFCILTIAACLSLTLAQMSSLNDLLTLQALDVDIPDAAIGHALRGGGGGGLASLLSRRRGHHNFGLQFGRQTSVPQTILPQANLQQAQLQQSNLGSFGNTRQTLQQFSGGNSLQQRGNVGFLNQQQQTLAPANVGQFASNALVNGGNTGLTQMTQQSKLSDFGTGGQNLFSQQSSLNALGGSQFGSLLGQNRLTDSTFAGIQRGNQGFGRTSRSLRRGVGGSRLSVLG
ncbi:unnamed protein product [Mytilus coruscus]|uniref:Uncharacterized protein n=1 Tax=Mytilus coruscus TaxID=42192 RepID=A0A6J8CCT2_MYTCO|nr:unnamed protein product [Mytilus coruscus]